MKRKYTYKRNLLWVFFGGAQINGGQPSITGYYILQNVKTKKVHIGNRWFIFFILPKSLKGHHSWFEFL